jgi:glucose/arabinose dehydrogenase
MLALSRTFALLGTLAALALLPAAPRGASAYEPSFMRGIVGNFSVSNPTSLAFGPDGRLYVGSLSQIRALTLDSAGTQVTANDAVATGQNSILGIAFDHTAPASPVVVYASRQNPAAVDSYEGVVSKYTGPSWTRTDVITGLPSSAPHTNHFTNGLEFDDQGQLLIAQGSQTDAGLQGPFYPETPLSAAILIADINAGGFDGTITYSPSGIPTDDNVDQTNGDVSVFAPGTRNPYDLVLHSNGNIYATDNGPTGGAYSATCTTSGSPSDQSDELSLIEFGDYYGFPNRNRGRTDMRQCTYHAPQEGNGADFTAPISILPAHCSCDGIAEYTSNQFGTTMLGDLLYTGFQNGNLYRAKLAIGGAGVQSTTTLASDFNTPLDVTVGPDGTIYVAEFGANRVSYLTPIKKPVGGASELTGVTDDNLAPLVLLALTAAASAAGAFAALRYASRR